RSQEIIDALEDRIPPMPASYIEEILEEESTITQYDRLQADVSHAYHEWKQWIRYAIKGYETDTVNGWTDDSIVDLLERQADLASKYFLVAKLFEMGDYENMYIALDNIESQFELSDEEYADYQEYVAWYEFMEDIASNRIMTCELNEVCYEELLTISGGENPITVAWARSMLLMNDDRMVYEEPIRVINGQQARFGQVPKREG
ncbi:MAG: hypothetical protein RQ761_13275, partial [Bacteroidales bacterium]|nr:hypothetical protein [Bacteroidales bacterium]